MITINDVKLLKLNTFVDTEGSLVSVQSEIGVPFKIKRTFRGTDKDILRSKHSFSVYLGRPK